MVEGGSIEVEGMGTGSSLNALILQAERRNDKGAVLLKLAVTVEDFGAAKWDAEEIKGEVELS